MGKRRASGDGAIYQDKDGRWRASVDLGYVNGKRKRKQFSGKARKEVADKLRAALKAQESGMDLADRDSNRRRVPCPLAGHRCRTEPKAVDDRKLSAARPSLYRSENREDSS